MFILETILLIGSVAAIVAIIGGCLWAIYAVFSRIGGRF